MSAEELVGTIEEVETHDVDPMPDDAADPWDEVTAEFQSLGRRLRDTYRQVADERSPSEEELRGAFATLAAAFGQVAESVGNALKDPEIRANLKHAAGAFATAVSTTISGLGTELGKDEETGSEEE
jgi:hypothetical protein